MSTAVRSAHYVKPFFLRILGRPHAFAPPVRRCDPLREDLLPMPGVHKKRAAPEGAALVGFTPVLFVYNPKARLRNTAISSL